MARTMAPTMAPTPPRPSGSRRPYRKGRVARLPLMNNSERGKYYRRKYKEYEVELEVSVAKLRKQVRDLELFMQVRAELAYRNPSDSCESIVGMIYEYFVRERFKGLRYETSFQEATAGSQTKASATRCPQHTTAAARTKASLSDASSESSSSCSPFDLSSMQSMVREWEIGSQVCSGGMEIPNTLLFFDLLSCHVEGGVDAPVVVMRGMLHTKYTLPTIDRVFPHLLHYQDLLDELLDKEVKYPCTYRFFFGAGGKFENKVVEADYIHGLQQVLGNLEDVMWLLDGAHRYTKHRDSSEDILRGPLPMLLDFDRA
jgi:hypothetical protein